MRRTSLHLNQLPLHNHIICTELNIVAGFTALTASNDNHVQFSELHDYLNHRCCQILASGLLAVLL